MKKGIEVPSYQRLKDGEPTTADDGERGVWYSAGGTCGYWTDDWDKLKTAGMIPCCPTCGAPGMQITFAKWIDGAKLFEDEGNAWYRKFLRDSENDEALRNRQPN